jgi:aspartate 1-decarboxylase
MIIKVLKSKIHRATVTEANLNYIGSISVDKALLIAANLQEYEKVHVLNITNGARLETYVISSPANSGEICINGAAAHLVNPNDKVIIVSYCGLESDAARGHVPNIVHVDNNNKIIN